MPAAFPAPSRARAAIGRAALRALAAVWLLSTAVQASDHPMAGYEVGETATYQVEGIARIGGQEIAIAGELEYTVAANDGAVVVISVTGSLFALDEDGDEADPIADIDEDVAVDLGRDVTEESLAEDYLRVLLAHDSDEELQDLEVADLPDEVFSLAELETDIECEAVSVTARVTRRDGGEAFVETIKILGTGEGVVPYLDIAGFEVTVQMPGGDSIVYRAEYAGQG